MSGSIAAVDGDDGDDGGGNSVDGGGVRSSVTSDSSLFVLSVAATLQLSASHWHC